MLRSAHERDLFGNLVPHSSAFRKDGRRRKVGYADKPGSGPKGKRCAQCRFAHRVLCDGRKALKCEIMSRFWSWTNLSDIQPRAPACSFFERRPPKPLNYANLH